MSTNKNIFYEQQLLAMQLVDLFSSDMRKKLSEENKKIKSVLPSPDKIYQKEIVQEQDPSNYSLNKPKSKLYNERYNSIDGKSSKDSMYYQYYDDYYGQYEEEKDHKDNHDSSKSNTNSKSPISSKDMKRKESEDESFKPSSIKVKNNSNETNLTKAKTDNDELPFIKSMSLPCELPRAKTKRELFKKRETSRFPFAKESQEDEEHLPDVINDILYKKSSRFLFFRDFQQQNTQNDCFLFEKEMGSLNASWAQFIKKTIWKKNTNI